MLRNMESVSDLVTYREHYNRENAMKRDPQKPPKNRDQDLPARKGDTIGPTTTPERSQAERERDKLLPEEESYERKSEKGRETDRR